MPSFWVAGIRRIEIGPEFDLVLTQDNELETREIAIDNQFEFETGDRIGFQVRHTAEQPRRRFWDSGRYHPDWRLRFYFLSDIDANQ